MIAERERWLNTYSEEPLDLATPLCDPHHHLWDHPDSHYMPEDLVKDIDGHNVVKTVFVECGAIYRHEGPREMKPVGETEFVQAIAGQGARGPHGPIAIAAGIVGFAYLLLGQAVEPVLEAHIAAGRGNLRGIRHTCAWDASPDIASYRSPPPGQLLDPKFREGLSCLKKYNLSFDAWLYFHQLMELVDAARALPDIPIILNHTGGIIHVGPYAGRHDEVIQQWRKGMAALAACPNVFVKLGGLGTPRCGFAWHKRPTPPGSAELAQAMSPYFLYCIEKFGPSRCMFESNFPVDRVSYSYGVMWNAFKRIAAAFSPDEQADLLYNTAVRAYRLE
ncbi:MAG: amidohydrolase family protein [Chloroflexota bacterium]